MFFSHSSWSSAMMQKGIWALLRQWERAQEVAWTLAQEALPFNFSYLCTVFVFYVKWLLDKNALREDRVLYSKENGAESGMTSFSCIQLDFRISKTGWVGVVFGQGCHLNCMQELSGRVLADVGQKHIEDQAKHTHARAWPKCNLYTPVQWNPYKLGV